ncbi:MAG: HTH domain-containing protein [Candidatus Omnitrophota bacterium]
MDKPYLFIKNHGKKKKEKPFEEKRMYRLMNVLSQLANRETVTTAGLAKQFGITKRTIQRDLMLLMDPGMGFPIYIDNDVYKFEENFSLRKIDVTLDEKLLLTLFYKLFSKAGQPFGSTAKNLLDKVLSASYAPEQSFDQSAVEIIKKEVSDFSNQLAVRLENTPYPESFIKKIDEYFETAKQKLRGLSVRDEVAIEFKTAKKYENGKPAATIRIPKAYFKSEIDKFDFSNHESKREFQIITYLPNKYIKNFKIELYAHMAFNFWGTHLEVRDLTSFDNFAGYLGFPKDLKRFTYEFSHGTHTKKHKILITTASLCWEKEIPMNSEDAKPFLNKSGGPVLTKKR